MPDVLYAKAQQIAHAALELTAAARRAYIDSRCDDDHELQREVEWLLAAVEDEALDTIPQAVQDVREVVEHSCRLSANAPGQYRLIEPVGEGGMGVVWLAEREVAGSTQRVALKRLHSHSMAHRVRLQEEQRILAQLTHPNISRLLDAGEDAHGVPFLAMEYIAGERIDHWCVGRAVELRGRVELFLKACAAVSYAHRKLIIHRDIKPANVLVDENGEPKLLDFGIARLLLGARSIDATTRVMTPAYASPEQLAGMPLGTATDIWSLGVMLYELLSGVQPFGAADAPAKRAETHAENRGSNTAAEHAQPRGDVRTHARAVLLPPSLAARQPGAVHIPADIDAIILKALRPEPDQRYASVEEMAADLQRFLRAQPVLARRGQWGYTARRFVQRNRWPLGVGVVFLAMVVAFTWQTLLAEREASRQARVADHATEFLVSAFALSDPAQGGRLDHTALEVLDRGRDRLEHELTDQPQVRARLLEALGNAYRGINEGGSGAPLLEAAAQLSLHPNINDPLAAARNLRAKSASILASNGSTQLAEDAAQRAFDLVQEHGQHLPLMQADAYGALALALDGAGKEQLAVRAARTALALRKAGNGSAHSVARSLIDLAAVTAGAGEHAEARAYSVEALALYRQAGAAKTNDYRLALRQLERTLVYSGQYEDGLAIARQRIGLTAELFGERSSVLAMERLTMTDRLAEHGLFGEAEGLLDLGMPVVLMRHGLHSTPYAIALFHKGWLSYLQGRFDQAVPPMRRALAIHESQVDGRDRGLLLVLRTTLAQVLIESGQANAQARALLESVIQERSKGDAHPAGLAYARLPLAQWHAARGEAVPARALLELVEQVGIAVEQELHARAAATRALLLAQEADLAGAAGQARHAYTLLLADRGAHNPRTARYGLAYAQAARAAGIGVGDLPTEDAFRAQLQQLYPADSAYLRAASAAIE